MGQNKEFFLGSLQINDNAPILYLSLSLSLSLTLLKKIKNKSMIDIFSSTVVLAYRSVCCNAEDYKTENKAHIYFKLKWSNDRRL